jgi:universal stress protein A
MAFRHVLVPTDFSEPASRALRYAFEEATLHHAKVTLLHVLAPHTGTAVYYVTGEPAPGPQDVDPAAGGRLRASLPAPPTIVRRDHYQEARTQLHDLIPDGFAGACDVEVAAGQPADAIVRAAEEREADLIVMGTHGRTGLQHVLLGSVAEKVVRLAPCPVLTVRHREKTRNA